MMRLLITKVLLKVRHEETGYEEQQEAVCSHTSSA
jgi:hypothetical protein